MKVEREFLASIDLLSNAFAKAKAHHFNRCIVKKGKKMKYAVVLSVAKWLFSTSSGLLLAVYCHYLMHWNWNRLCECVRIFVPVCDLAQIWRIYSR